MCCSMKKTAVTIFFFFLLFLLVSRSLIFADEKGKGNERKNENGALVTTEGEFRIVKNKNNMIIIKIKSDNDKKNHDDKKNQDNDDHKNEDDRDLDDDDIKLSPTPTGIPAVSPTPSLSITPTVTPSETPIPTPTQFVLNAKIKGAFTLDQLAAIFERILSIIKNALGTT